MDCRDSTVWASLIGSRAEMRLLRREAVMRTFGLLGCSDPKPFLRHAWPVENDRETGMPANRKSTMRQLREVLRLHHGGVSAREIGRRRGLARSTVDQRGECALRAVSTPSVATPIGPLPRLL